MTAKITSLYACLRHALAFVLVLLANGIIPVHGHAQGPDRVQVSVRYSQAPLLVRMPASAATQVRIWVPAGRTITVDRITLSLDADAVRSIEKLNVHRSERYESAFDPAAPVIATGQPASKTEIRLNAACNPGLTHFWISVALKDDADIDRKIGLRVVSLTTDGQNARGRESIDLTTTGDPVFRLGVALRRGGEDDAHTYRIPGIVTTDKGTLISVYDIRYSNSRDLPGNIDVGMSRSTDGGRTWEPMRVIMDMGAPHENNGVGDPAIVFDPRSKKIFVAALWSKGNRSIAGSLPGLSPDSTGQLVLVESADDGVTWSEPVSITSQVKVPAWHICFNGPGMGIAMEDGKLVFAAQYWDEKRMPYSTIIYSDDQGKTWNGKVRGPKPNTTESQVVETTPGTLMLNMRDNRGEFRSIATSSDLGKTWTEHHTSQFALPDPVCMASILKARVTVGNGRRDVLFFSNPATSSGRYNMTLRASLDLGETWPDQNQLLIDERRCYGYSCLTKIDESTLGLVYEGVSDLYFVRVPVAEVIASQRSKTD